MAGFAAFVFSLLGRLVVVGSPMGSFKKKNYIFFSSFFGMCTCVVPPGAFSVLLLHLKNER